MLQRGVAQARGDRVVAAHPLGGVVQHRNPLADEVGRRQRIATVERSRDTAAGGRVPSPRCDGRRAPSPRTPARPRCHAFRRPAYRGGTMLATLRTTKISPGPASKITSGDTRLSEQPMIMIRGFWPSAASRLYPLVLAWISPLPESLVACRQTPRERGGEFRAERSFRFGHRRKSGWRDGAAEVSAGALYGSLLINVNHREHHKVSIPEGRATGRARRGEPANVDHGHRADQGHPAGPRGPARGHQPSPTGR